MMIRKLSSFLFSIIATLTPAFAAVTKDFSPEQYKRAAWMTTRFYGGQRSGIGPNWLIMEHENPAYRTSFTKDADGSRDLEGGWFDCGDHVTFGQTFFFSAYVLAKAYEAFPKGFHDLYTGLDYRDYVKNKNWDITGGAPNGIPDLLEEIKYATDWTIKATPDANTFYYEKGSGQYDHTTWVTAGKMSTQKVEQGGEPRPIAKNPDDGHMASFAAAVLSLMSRLYVKYDPVYAQLCAKHAEYAYNYAKPRKNQAVGAKTGGFYGAPKAPVLAFVVAAAEMYKTTGDAKYLSDVNADRNRIETHNYGFDYSNFHDLAPYAIATCIPLLRDTMLQIMKKTFVDYYLNSVNGEKVCTKGNGGWGALRYPANHALVVALYSRAMGITTYDQFIYDQIDYIMGSNNAKQSFITGFCEGCNKEPKLIHHRNFFLRDDNPTDEQKEKMTIPPRNRYFGYLVGGKWVSTEYTESVTNYATTEGGIDYNAGLVGTLGYIVSNQLPADTSKMGPTAIEKRTGTLKNHSETTFFSKGGVLTLTPGRNEQITSVTLFTPSGKVLVKKCFSAGERMAIPVKQPSGLYLVKFSNSSGFDHFMTLIAH
jgi:hypothetical protein